MSNPELVARIRDHFERQITWFEELRAELATFESQLDTVDLETLDERQRVRASGTRILEEEFRLLRRDWMGDARLSEEERAEMHVLAQRADALAQEVGAALDRADTLVQERMALLRESSAELQRGQETLRHYRAGQTESSNFLDRKA